MEKLQVASYSQPQIGTALHLFIFCAMDSLVKNNEKLISSMKENIPKEKFNGYSKMLNGALPQMDSEEQKRMSERELFIPAEIYL